jgi:hypothetical protein
VIASGKWVQVQRFATDGNGAKPLTIEVRALFEDDRVKRDEPRTPRQLSERLFVVRRGFRGVAVFSLPRLLPRRALLRPSSP